MSLTDLLEDVWTEIRMMIVTFSNILQHHLLRCMKCYDDLSNRRSKGGKILQSVAVSWVWHCWVRNEYVVLHIA